MRAIPCFFLVLLTAQVALAEDSLVWITTDFTSGGLAHQIHGDCDTNELSTLVPGDATIRSQNGYVFVIGRLGADNVTVFDADDLEHPVIQFSTGNGTNPQDLLLVGPRKAYITLFEGTNVLIADPTTGQIAGSIDMSTAADSDGIPEMTSLIQYGEYVLVVCQRLDRSTPMMEPSGVGCITMIDPVTDTVIDADPTSGAVDPLWLPLANPVAHTVTDTEILFACAGSWSDLTDGGLVLLQEASSSFEILALEDAVQANIGGVAVAGEHTYVVLSDETWTNSVIPFDPSTNQFLDPLEQTSGGYIPMILSHETLLYVADQGTWSDPARAGILVYDATSNELQCGPLSTGLPPMAGSLVEPMDAIPQNGHLDHPSFSMLWPNPAVNYIGIRAELWHEQGISIQLFDLCGRRIFETQGACGSRIVSLSDVQNGTLSNGSYLIRVATETWSEDHILIVRR